mmetsp:Transcript_49302/g.112230  ORF Transcript_49302/g.112230 Transcript_49302/m.112230 type:complete len:83 (-) Transcript_49302:101-349(-)
MDCSRGNVTVAHMKLHQSKDSSVPGPGASLSRCKYYARYAFNVACGDKQRGDSGFFQRLEVRSRNLTKSRHGGGATMRANRM